MLALQLNSFEKIVNPDGTPTFQFVTKWNQMAELVSSLPGVLLDSDVLTVGTDGSDAYGFAATLFGSMADGDFTPYGNDPILALVYDDAAKTFTFWVDNNHPNRDWYMVLVNNTAFIRSQATYQYSTLLTASTWLWPCPADPFTAVASDSDIKWY